MPLDLRIVGPELEVSRRLKAGEPALVLGRDADCAICLPDPLRNVSRRHLSVWNEGEQLQFQVLSVVNGVETSEGEFPPGARGVLAADDVLVLSDYKLTVSAVVVPPGEPGDPWDDFEKEAQRLLATVAVPPPATDDDPFGEWGFQSTFGPGAGNQPLQASAVASAELGAFFAGLGVPAVTPGTYTPGELESMGRLTRAALQGLLLALQAAGGSRQAVGGDERTMLAPAKVNPLRMDTPLESKLWYLFGGHAAAAGCIPPERAVGEVVDDLLGHHRAMGEAARAAVRGVLAEFDPETLKGQLLPGGARLFESARAWEAYARAYAERRQDIERWVGRLMDRYFAEAYAQALARVKRDTGAGPGG